MNTRAYAREYAENHVVLTTLPTHTITVYWSEGGIREVVECDNREDAFEKYDEWTDLLEDEIMEEL